MKKMELKLDCPKKMVQFARILRQRAEQDWDNLCAVTGEVGVGKSNLAQALARLVDKDFTFEKNMLFQPTAEKFSEKIRKLPKGSAIIADEAIRIFYKLEWQSSHQKYLNKILELAREENKTIFLCLPRFLDLNEKMRNNRVKFWIHVYARGKAVVLIRDDEMFSPSPFHLRINYKVMVTHKIRKLTEQAVVNIYRKYISNYYIHFDFPDFDPEMKKEYKALKNKYAYKDLTLKMPHLWKHRCEILWTMLHRGFHMASYEICEMIDMPPNYNIRQVASDIWTRLSIEKRDRYMLFVENTLRKKANRNIFTNLSSDKTRKTPIIKDKRDSEEHLKINPQRLPISE